MRKMENKPFKLHSKYSPTGDQPEAIKSLTEGVLDGLRAQVLVGVTGSGKTFTMAREFLLVADFGDEFDANDASVGVA